MIDHSSDFDARRIGWWARRGAVRQIQKSSAITDADRALRMQQARAAQTRGEISALTRGLSPTTASVAAPYVPPAGPSAHPQPPRPPAQYAQPPRPPAQYPPPAYQPPPVPVKRKGSFHPKLLIGLVIALLACGGGVVSCVSSVVDSVRDFSDSSPAPAPDLQTEEGWSEMIASFASETDLAETVSVAVRRGSATLAVESDDSTGAGYYFDGDVTTTDDVALDGNQEVFDLGDIDPSVVVEAVAQARRSSGEPESTEALVQVGSANGAPQILVEFLAGASDTYALVVDDDGTVVSETR